MSSDAFDKTADAGTGYSGPVALKAGAQLGKYRLDRILGEGGMGVVWAAHDPDLERAVAIKVLRHAEATTQLRQRLLREARAMAKLKHANVLTVYEVGTVDDRDYIAMELVDGQSLDEWLGHATYEERWDAILAAGRGLAAAHAAGVVHRDFKPHNILRSRNGRVLVTDFGLARGMVGEDDAVPFSATRSGDAVLDTPMTQTGALIGTPAYMAPEQYRGAAPDPRTDQFAFCVTAWQALTGDRPFKGATLEEMRNAVEGGVAHIPTKLPKAVRAVLARGLDPDPAERYSSLEELLDALERAAKLPARRRGFIVAAFGLVMAGALIFQQTRSNNSVAANDCDHPERIFAATWTHGQLKGRAGDAIDQFGKRWVDAYTQACRGAPEAKPARTACLQGALDDVEALVLMLRQANPARTEHLDTSTLLPNLRACEATSPLAPVLVPRSDPARTRAMIVLAKLLTLRATPTPELASTLAELEQEALAAGGSQFAGSVLVSGGNEYLQRGETQKARELFTRFLKATPRNQRLEAVTRMSLVEVSLSELAEPHTKSPPDLLDPRGKPMLHPELTNLLTAARSATSTDDALAGVVGLLDARARMHLGQWNRYRRAYSDALEAATLARRRFDAIGDVRRSAVALTTMAEIYLERGDETALDDAQFALRQAGDLLDVANLDTHEVDRLRAQVALLRRDYGEAHRRFDASAQIQPMIEETVKGRVVGAAGKSVTVVAWQGELVGDRTRVYTDPHFKGDVVQVADDGTFTVHARPDWAIIAEAKGMRSKPMLVGTSPELQLVATTTVSGSATGHNLLGVSAFARYTIGDSHLSLRAAIDRDDRFDLVGLPPGPMQLGLIGPAGSGERIIRGDDAWPSGQAIEAILRGHADALVYVLRGTVNPKTIDEVEKLAREATDVASCMPSTIGADNTDAGREVYRAGDYHCVITGNATGPVTVCAGNDERLTCKPLDVKPTVEVSYPDGRYAAGVTPVVLEL